MSRFPEAASRLEEALRLDPESASAHALLSSVYRRMGRFPESEREIATALRLNPGQYAYHWLEGILAGAQRDTERALRCGERALELNPASGDVLAWLARVRFVRGEAGWAEDLSRRAIAAENCTHADAYYLLCLLAFRRGDRREAERMAREGLGRFSDAAKLHAMLGHTALYRGDSRVALEHFQESLRLDPTRSQGELSYRIAHLASQGPLRFVWRLHRYLMDGPLWPRFAMIMGPFVVLALVQPSGAVGSAALTTLALLAMLVLTGIRRLDRLIIKAVSVGLWEDEIGRPGFSPSALPRWVRRQWSAEIDRWRGRNRKPSESQTGKGRQ